MQKPASKRLILIVWLAFFVALLGFLLWLRASFRTVTPVDLSTYTQAQADYQITPYDNGHTIRIEGYALRENDPIQQYDLQIALAYPDGSAYALPTRMKEGLGDSGFYTPNSGFRAMAAHSKLPAGTAKLVILWRHNYQRLYIETNESMEIGGVV